MRLPRIRITVRRMLVAAVGAGLLLWGAGLWRAAAAYRERAERYARLAGPTSVCYIEPDGLGQAESVRRWARHSAALQDRPAYYEALRLKYEHAASHPWLPVSPDPLDLPWSSEPISSGERPDLAVGLPAPEIDGEDFTGRRLTLSAHRGRVVVLTFWDGSCPSCQLDMPRERELAERYRGRPLALLGVHCQEPKAAGAETIRAQGISWPSWHDGRDGPDYFSIMARYHVSALPTVFVIDARGSLRSRSYSVDSLDGASLEELVREAEGSRHVDQTN